MALQITAGHYEFGGLFGVLRDDRIAVAESIGPVSIVDRDELWW